MKSNVDRTVLVIFENGEHMVGKEIEQDDESILVLEDPVSLVPDPESGKLGFYVATQFSASNIMELERRHLRCRPLEVKADILKGYDSQFGSGIIAGSSNIIQV